VTLLFLHRSTHSRWKKWRHAGTSPHASPCSNAPRQIAQSSFSDALLPTVEYGKYRNLKTGAAAVILRTTGACADPAGAGAPRPSAFSGFGYKQAHKPIISSRAKIQSNAMNAMGSSAADGIVVVDVVGPEI
jgi:hypothetical protein